MNKLITGVAALTVLFAAPALGADIPLKAPPRPAIFSWTGCYLGVNGGWIGSAGNQDIDTSLSGAFLRNDAQAQNIFAVPPARGSLDRHFSQDLSSGTAGITSGCNVQYGSWVWGFETDSNWAGIDDTVTVNFPVTVVPGTGGTTAASNTQTITRRLDYFSTYRGRIGLAFDRWMLYATGGAVVAHIKGETSIQYANDGFFLQNFQFFGDRRVWRMGWTAGGGLEYAFSDNWSLKAEYLFLDLRDFNYEAFCFVAACGANPGQFSVNTRLEFKEHVARVGLNYRFLWGELPVVARY